MSKIKIGQLWLALFGLAFLFSCTPKNNDDGVLLQGKTMGTIAFNVKVYPGDVALNQTTLLASINQELQLINQLMSTYIPDSELSKFNASKAGEVTKLSPYNQYLFEQSLRLYQISDGAFDVTIGPLVNLWGFGPEGRVTKRPTEQQINQLAPSLGSDKLVLAGNALSKKHDKTYVDFSAIAKGFAVDKVAELLEEKGFSNYLVEIGGELKVSGVKSDGNQWKIAIEKPVTELRQVQLIISPGDMAMATSGDYRNYFEQDGVRYSHTLDIRTGSPISHKLVSVTILDKSSAMADALATAITVMGAEQGLTFAEKHNIAAYMLVKSADGFEEVVSSAFKPYLPK